MIGSFEIDEIDGIQRLKVSGEVELGNEEAFCQALDRLATSARGAAVLDLQACEYLDSSALRHLIHFSKSFTDRACVSVVNRNVGRIFEIVGMRRVLAYYYSLNDALDSVK